MYYLAIFILFIVWCGVTIGIGALCVNQEFKWTYSESRVGFREYKNAYICGVIMQLCGCVGYFAVRMIGWAIVTVF